MYKEFYGFTELPFNITSDPDFLYMSHSHEEAFNHLLYGIRERKGFLQIIGEAGTGKTTLCKVLMNYFSPEETEIAYVFNPCLSEVQLLQCIINDFGIVSSSKSRHGLLNALYEFLLSNAKQKKNALLILDEAQDLKPRVLEQVRLLSNLETPKEKLLQIALLGQPPLEKKLNQPKLEQFRQRIAVKYYLKPLGLDEVQKYVYHRLIKAGSPGGVKFTEEALDRVFYFSKGIPRLINILCDRCLLAGFINTTRLIGIDLVEQSVAELAGEFKHEYHQRSLKESV